MTKELHTFDRKGMEEVKRYVRENMRRLRGGQLFPGRWQKGGAGGSGGGSSCCCTCVCVDPNMEHPGGFDTTSIFTVELPNPTFWEPTADGSGECRVKAGSYDVAWEDASEHWDRDLTASDIEFRNLDGDIETPQSATGTLVMDWPDIDGRITYLFTFDAVGTPVIPFP